MLWWGIWVLVVEMWVFHEIEYYGYCKKNVGDMRYLEEGIIRSFVE